VAGISIHLDRVSIRRGSVWALREVSLQLNARQRYALVGPNGAGKTQLLKLLAGDVWPTPTGRERLEYRQEGRRVDLIDIKSRLVYFGAERQDKYARYGWNPTVAELIATGIANTDLLLAPLNAAGERRVRMSLRAAGLLRLAARRFASLSYGQKRVALLARALVAEPAWLLLDELYNGLDRKYRRRVDSLLAAARKRGQSWVVAAHRMEDIPAGTRQLISLDTGRVRLRQRFDRAACATRLRETKVAAHSRVRSSPWQRGAAPRDALLSVANADLYVNGKRLLTGMDWTVRSNEHWALVGANGSGKTSLLKMIYGDLAPAFGGRIQRRGLAPGMHIESWKRHTAFIGPELQTDCVADYPRLSVLELVASGRAASLGFPEAMCAADRRSARRALDSFDVAQLAARPIIELSYGELRRVLFARALTARPRLWLLDEPLTGLDPPQRAKMRALLVQLARRGAASVMAVHHLEDLPPIMTHVIELARGRFRIGSVRRTS
jgi:molybdate transport system ATP-binding protein